MNNVLHKYNINIRNTYKYKYFGCEMFTVRDNLMGFKCYLKIFIFKFVLCR